MDEEQKSGQVHSGEYLLVLQLLGIFELTDLGDTLIVFKLISLAGTGAYFIYSYIRGLPNGVAIVTAAADAFPFFGWLPLRMAGYTVAVIMANNPKIADVAGAAGKLAMTAGAGAAAGAAARTAGAAGQAGVTAAEKTATATTQATSSATTGSVTAQSAQAGVTTAGGYAYSGAAGGAPTGASGSGGSAYGGGTSTTGGAPASGAAQYAEEFKHAQDPMLQMNRELLQETPGTVGRPTGGQEDVSVNDDTNTVQLPYAAR